MLPECYIPMPMFEIVKKCKISLSALDQVAGEHYRTVGPLVYTLQYTQYEYIYNRKISSALQLWPF